MEPAVSVAARHGTDFFRKKAREINFAGADDTSGSYRDDSFVPKSAERKIDFPGKSKFPLSTAGKPVKIGPLTEKRTTLWTKD
jgi:hypothetical protein